MELPRSIDTVVVGAGQAGLIMSRLLTSAGREHVVLERRKSLGGGWQDRWDSFRLVSPNFLASLPDYPYDGPEPDAYMTRDEMVGRVRAYSDVVGAPVVAGTEVRVLSQDGAAGQRLHLETSGGPIDAESVISATGAFHVPRIPKAADGFPASILQLHSHDYRNPDQLPPGGVLIVGSGQTGVQLAEELHRAGRAVVLSTGRCWRIPRRYRGYDCFWWIRQIIDRGAEYDTFFPTVAQLPSPAAKFACNAQLSGHDGGHDSNLRQMGLDGIRLAGRFAGTDGRVARFEPDLAANLKFGDEFFDEKVRPLLDTYAERAGIETEPDERAWPQYDPPELTELDLAAAGISTVLWTTGYVPEYGWLKVPILDEFGVPRHVRGVSDVPGLLFLGLLFQHDNGSANLAGVARDAEYLAAQM